MSAAASTQSAKPIQSDVAAAIAARRDYKAGFVTDIVSETVLPGLSEDVIRLISAKKEEPQWLLDWRLKAYRHWLTMTPPDWAKLKVPPIDLQAISYYSRPKSMANAPKSLAEVDPKLLETFERLGIPINEQKRLANVAVDYVFDSASIATTFKQELKAQVLAGSLWAQQR